MATVVTVDKAGRIVIPKDTRDAQKLRSGTQLLLVEARDGPWRPRPPPAAGGAFPPPGPPPPGWGYAPRRGRRARAGVPAVRPGLPLAHGGGPRDGARGGHGARGRGGALPPRPPPPPPPPA